MAHLGQVAEFVEDWGFTPEAGFANLFGRAVLPCFWRVQRPGNSAFHDLSGEGAQAHVRQLIFLLLLVTQMALAGLTHRMATMEKKQDEILGILRSGPPGACFLEVAFKWLYCKWLLCGFWQKGFLSGFW